jgi:hypothetical protein
MEELFAKLAIQTVGAVGKAAFGIAGKVAINKVKMSFIQAF